MLPPAQPNVAEENHRTLLMAWFHIYDRGSQKRTEDCQTASFLGNLFSQLLSSLFTLSLLSSSFQHSFLSAPLSANDLALHFIEKREAVRLERPHLSTISSPTLLYLYSNTLPSFLLKREEDRWDLVFYDWIVCHCLKNIAATITRLCFIIPVSIQTWLGVSCKAVVSEY